ncbi:MAG: alpha/beta hydrolase [Kiritimatiellaceae bacterium]|nr:alpha/beta hydrolase [Kiritimatiellaceae bacterium]
MKTSFFLRLIPVLLCGSLRAAEYVTVPDGVEKALQAANTPAEWAKLMPEAKQYIYKQVGDLAMPLYVFPAKPQANRKPAVLVLMAGGAFRDGKPSYYRHALEYSARGITVVTPKYRGTDADKAQVIDCYRDGRDAVIWVRDHADEIGVDRDRIVVGGSSAGSLIALALATLDFLHEEVGNRKAVPDALLLYDIASGGAMTAPVEGDPILGPEPARFWNWYTKERFGMDPVLLSPFHHLNDKLPPACLFLGGKENMRQQYGAWLLYSTATGKGASWDMHFVAKMPHAAMVNSAAWAPEVYRTVVNTTTLFLRRYDFLPKE